MKFPSILVPAVLRVATILFLLCAMATPFAQSQITFFQTPTYPGTAAVIGDFNLDGKQDIINSAGTVLLGRGDGTFATGTTLSNVPSFVADFNDDGKPDVLAFTSSYHLFVYLGNGDGTFQSPQDTYAAVSLVGLLVADVNGDNKPDVLVPNSTGGVLVYLGKGDGTFGTPANYPSPGGVLFIGDFNGDGKPDVLEGSSGFVSVLLGNGDGTFQAAKTTTSSALGSVLTIGDLNGDQKLDLLICSLPCAIFQQFATMFGNGDGTFQAPSNQFSPQLSNSPTLADVNGDGKLDLLVQGYPSIFLQVYLGNGDGTFALGQTYSYNSANLYPSNILVGDFNGDQKPDITASQSILFGNGDGTFQASTAFLSVVYPSLAGDFNGDGRTDIATASGVYLAGATGSFTLGYTYTIPVNEFLQSGDFNGDGKLDLITEGNSGGTAVLLGNGDGSFGTPVESTSCPAANLGIGAVADLNGDLKSDLAFPNGESLSICLGNGDGTFASAVNYFYGDTASSVVIADFNNDGKLDAAVGGGAGIAIFLGNGDGTFQVENYLLTTGARVGPAADFNRDGNVDLIINGTVYLGDGKGGFQPLTQTTTGLCCAVVDLNGDGYLDLFEDNYFIISQQIYVKLVFLGNGDGTFQAPIVFKGGNYKSNDPGVGLTGDFNGDGRPDLAIGWGALIGTPTGFQILLNTTPLAPAANFSPLAVVFPSQTAGTSSSPVSVTLSNTGKGVLNVSGAKVAGANASEFDQTNNCTSVQPGASCTIKVAFAPTAAGNASASLAVTDNAVGSPQKIALSGTATAAPDFAIGPASGSSNSATVIPGQTASFNLALTPAGSFNGAVSLSCAITPVVGSAPVCTVPASVNAAVGTATPVAVKVSTTAGGAAGSISSGNFPSEMRPITWTMVLLAVGLLFAGWRRRLPALAMPTVAFVLLVIPGCGGGGGGSSSSTSGTPAGTYAATVTAKSGKLSHSATLTVIVQ
jgi:FG-GAP-like repeat/Abnormal spindle-like microcephaly-assoc'd, ASPM-SPD-2-Hydin